MAPARRADDGPAARGDARPRRSGVGTARSIDGHGARRVRCTAIAAPGATTWAPRHARSHVQRSRAAPAARVSRGRRHARGDHAVDGGWRSAPAGTDSRPPADAVPASPPVDGLDQIVENRRGRHARSGAGSGERHGIAVVSGELDRVLHAIERANGCARSTNAGPTHAPGLAGSSDASATGLIAPPSARAPRSRPASARRVPRACSVGHGQRPASGQMQQNRRASRPRRAR